MSKIPADELRKAANQVLHPEKKRKFLETIELQLSLKGYDPNRDKRFNGSIAMPYVPRPNLKICVFGDDVHNEQAVALGLDTMKKEQLEAYKSMKKEEKNKAVKTLAGKYDAFLASDAILKMVPRWLGPGLNKAGKFPTAITHGEDMSKKVNEIRAQVKFQLKKVTCLSVAIGNMNLTEDQLMVNIQLSLNFLVSMLKKHWQNLGAVYIKSTMGKPVLIY
jgi:large subunit ribosomal protein L10Ae